VQPTQSRTSLPEDLENICAQLTLNEQAAQEVLAGLTAEQANWRPDGTRSWSIAQCIDHLARTNDVYGAALADAIQRSILRRPRPRRGPIAPGWLARRFLRNIEPPVKFRVAAAPVVLPEDARDPQQALQGLLESHESVRQLMADAADLDLNRIRFRNPFARNIRLFSVGTGFMILPAHERRHLLQAQKLRERIERA
jgi:hypothetical protein